MNIADKALNAADTVARRYTRWKLNRDLFRDWKPAPAITQLRELERWVSSDGTRTCIVPADDYNPNSRTITVSIDGFHELMTSAGWIRSDDIQPPQPQDAA